MANDAELPRSRLRCARKSAYTTKTAYFSRYIKFAVHKKRYHVVYAKNGVVVRQEFFDSKEELKLKFAASNIKIQNGKYRKSWIKQDDCWCYAACLALNV